MDVLNEDALRLVLERVDSHVSLIRAAAVCRRWRRAIADAAFLRRYRSLRAPPVAGEYRNAEGHRPRASPVFAPSSPPVVDARHFSLDFLPGGAASWTLRGSRGSLLLLHDAVVLRFSTKFVVCEPLTRRYKRIVPPADLYDDSFCWRSYLIDGERDEAGSCIGMSNFRVVFMFKKVRGDNMCVAMYTEGLSWSEKKNDHIVTSLKQLHKIGRGGGCWYFVQDRRLIILDGSTGDFSSSELPPFLEDWHSPAVMHNFFVTNGQDGKLRIFTVFDGTMKVFVMLEGGEWALEKRVLLSEATRGLPGYELFSGPQFVFGGGTGYVILAPHIQEPLTPYLLNPWFFSINLDTMEATSVVKSMTLVYGCELPWPPSLHACLDG